jgi:hypothetical protein
MQEGEGSKGGAGVGDDTQHLGRMYASSIVVNSPGRCVVKSRAFSTFRDPAA